MPDFTRQISKPLWSHATSVAAALCLLLGLPALAHAEACPNEAFRSGPSTNLPDCRAYEMVSPPEKNGADIYVRPVAPSPNGEAVSFTSISGFAGATSDLYTNTKYQANRGVSGWNTVAQTQSEAKFINRHGIITADERDESFGNEEYNLEGGARLYLLQELGKPEADLDFYLTRAGGANSEIGPALPPTAVGLPPRAEIGAEYVNVRGMSADAQHVVFEDPEPTGPNQWSFGAPGALLEYSGTGNTVPLLVGVDDSGHFVNNCPRQLLGGVESNGNPEFTSFSDPISTDGSRIFFTDECKGGLFARLDNGQSDAHTVELSEPTAAECTACDTAVAVQQSAHFIGASEDGSKVLFRTEQPLLTGGEGLYEYDFDAPEGQKVTLIATGYAPVMQISQDGSHVYFRSRSVLTEEPSPGVRGLDAHGNPVESDAVAQAGEANLYVFERDSRYPGGHVAFIATTETSFAQSSVTPDGRFLVFVSSAALTPGDTSGGQVFEYDAETESMTYVSIGEHGYNNNGNGTGTELAESLLHIVFEPTAYTDGLSVSADGSYVFFVSTSALTPQALNNVQIGVFNGLPEFARNIYEFHDGNVYLLSDGEDVTTQDENGRVRLLGADLSGRDVYFTTSDQLAPEDTDSDVDIYDARIGGGFPAPAAAPSCSDDACQGQLSPAPILLSPGSEFQAGGDNLAPAPVKPAAKAKKKVKPTKKKVKPRKRPKPTKAKRTIRRHSTRGGRK